MVYVVFFFSQLDHEFKKGSTKTFKLGIIFTPNVSCCRWFFHFFLFCSLRDYPPFSIENSTELIVKLRWGCFKLCNERYITAALGANWKDVFLLVLYLLFFCLMILFLGCGPWTLYVFWKHVCNHVFHIIFHQFIVSFVLLMQFLMIFLVIVFIWGLVEFGHHFASLEQPYFGNP